MKVLVCGGRNYDNYGELERVLDELYSKNRFDLVVHGAARGADSMAKDWAIRRGVPEVGYPAMWNTYGKGAGHIRNQQMLDEEKPDLVVAFPGGRGTDNMIARSIKAGVRVHFV